MKVHAIKLNLETFEFSIDYNFVFFNISKNEKVNKKISNLYLYYL